MLLAGLMLKIGAYGLVRYSMVLFPEAHMAFAPIVYTIALLSVLYSSCAALAQTDFKRIIAYSSIAHMNFGLLGLFTGTLEGLQRAVFVLISHGFVSSALFLTVGALYERTHTRSLAYYRGLAATMPCFAVFLVLFSFGNIALPGTSAFVGELLVLVGVFVAQPVLATVGAALLLLGSGYSL